MQWVSTFACGAPSLGRPRYLTAHPAESGPPSPQGTFGENSPHIYKEHPEGKNGEKIFWSSLCEALSCRSVNQQGIPCIKKY